MQHLLSEKDSPMPRMNGGAGTKRVFYGDAEPGVTINTEISRTTAEQTSLEQWMERQDNRMF